MRGRARLVFSAVTAGGIFAAFVAPSASFPQQHLSSGGPGTVGVPSGPTYRVGHQDDRRLTLVDFTSTPITAGTATATTATATTGTATTANGPATAVVSRLEPTTSTSVAARSPTPPPAPPPAPAPAPPPPAPANTLGGVWACIRAHESGGNYATDTGNGYYGAYQFSEATWLGIGGTGYPDDAPPSVQDALAQRLQQRSGWRQWSTHARCGV